MTSRAPRHLRIGSDRAGTFERCEDVYAVRMEHGNSLPGALAQVESSEHNRYAILAGEPRATGTSEEVVPVYSAGKGGPYAIPTGRLFVRFTKGVTPADRRTALDQLGFQVERTLSYAPNAAWVAPRAGGATYALEQLEAVQTIPGVEHVEPQLLMERSRKSSERP